MPVAEKKLDAHLDIPLTVAKFGLFLPILWIVSPGLGFADYSSIPVGVVSGGLIFLPSLFLVYRSHYDLGINWSTTLEVRENHSLITGGVYQNIRHPMYLGMLLFSLGLAFAVPNYLAGPSMLIAMVALCVFRVGAEEQMMIDVFGDEYELYRQRSARLIPGVW